MTYEHRFGIIGANLKEQRMSRDFRTLCFMIRNHQFRFRRFKKLRQYQKLWLLLKEESGENLPWVNTSIMGEKTFQKCVWGGHQALLFCRRRHAQGVPSFCLEAKRKRKGAKRNSERKNYQFRLFRFKAKLKILYAKRNDTKRKISKICILKKLSLPKSPSQIEQLR